MNAKNITAILALSGALALAGGCSKTEDSAPPVQTTNKPAETPKPMMEQATNAVAKAVDVVTNLAMPAKAAAVQTAATAMQAATNATTAATAAAGSTAQGLIDQAKSYVADKKYQPALDTLSKLSSYTLTADQQATVAGLKGQIQKLMTSDAASAVGNMLGH